MQYSQTLVTLAASYGKFDVKQALPSTTTINRCRSEVRYSSTFSCSRCSSYNWTDDHRKYSYVTATAHLFDSDLNLHSSVLNRGCVEERKTADVLGKVVGLVDCSK